MDIDLERFSALLDDAVATAQASGWRDRIERVLTDGYSEVLALETARRDAYRRLDGGDLAASKEIARLDEEIHTLRELLERATRAVYAA